VNIKTDTVCRLHIKLCVYSKTVMLIMMNVEGNYSSRFTVPSRMCLKELWVAESQNYILICPYVYKIEVIFSYC
jgi:hypothetical protein